MKATCVHTPIINNLHAKLSYTCHTQCFCKLEQWQPGVCESSKLTTWVERCEHNYVPDFWSSMQKSTFVNGLICCSANSFVFQRQQLSYPVERKRQRPLPKPRQRKPPRNLTPVPLLITNLAFAKILYCPQQRYLSYNGRL